MWLRALGAIILGLMLYVGAALMFANIITGTSQSEQFTRNVVPMIIGGVTVGIAGMALFHHN